MERTTGRFGLVDFVLAKTRRNWCYRHNRFGAESKSSDLAEAIRARRELGLILPYRCSGFLRYGLSGQKTEYARLESIIRFVGFSLESVPDHPTMCRFRNALVEENALPALLDEVIRQMEQQGKLVKI